MAHSIPAASVKKIVIACEAGMGSSLMAANKLKQMLKKAGFQDIQVTHSPVRALTEDAQIVLSHEGLSAMARSKAPWAVCFAFKNFMNIPAYDKIINALRAGEDIVED